MIPNESKSVKNNSKYGEEVQSPYFKETKNFDGSSKQSVDLDDLYK
jgi:hypothetical protein